MGIDILIVSDKDEEINSADRFSEEIEQFFKGSISLSRTFCNFMSRKDIIDHEPELDQIGRIAGVDIRPLYEMESYPDEDSINYELERADDSKERESILARAKKDQERIQGNLGAVISVVNSLIQKLDQIDNLPAQLMPTERDTLNNKAYFSDKVDEGIGDNFVQYLRNFRQHLEYIKSKDGSTVWFHYG
ncbi:MAG: hypothetical protein AAF632_23505 [Bacteroidota bacterium]